MTDRFQAFLVQSSSEGAIRASILPLTLDQLPAGDVLIQVHWSSLNFKDSLAAQGHPGVVRSFPHVPGIDAAGVVVASDRPQFAVGQSVIVTGYDLGASHWGGWSRYLRVPAEWVVALPPGLSLLESMSLGTAGFTAAMCVQQLQKNDVDPTSGPIIVTGATGGVGCIAVQLLSKLGYDVTASTGKSNAHDWLKRLGANRVIARDQLRRSDRPLGTAQWAGAVDTVGGSTLTGLLQTTQPFGCVTACGLVGGVNLNTTVHPFILRGVVLSGVSASQCQQPRRDAIWSQLAGPWKLTQLDDIARRVSLNDLPAEVNQITKGKLRGRVVVSLAED